MTRDRLASLAAYAGDRLHPVGASGPFPFGPHVPVRMRNAVYVVCAWSGRVVYVGSTTIGVRTRFAQHVADRARTLDWATAYIIPLTDGIPACEVRRIEGRIGLAAGPEQTKALPRIAESR